MIRTFQYLLLPTGRQQRALSDLLRLSAELYNAALQERADAWRRQRKSVGYFEQCKELTELRREDETIRAIPVALAREPLRRVHRALQGFFRRVKAGRKPGYPRFRSMDRYNSFSRSAPGFGVEGERVLIHKLGGLRVPMEVPGERERYLKTATEIAVNGWNGARATKTNRAPPKMLPELLLRLRTAG